MVSLVANWYSKEIKFYMRRIGRDLHRGKQRSADAISSDKNTKRKQATIRCSR